MIIIIGNVVIFSINSKKKSLLKIITNILLQVTIDELPNMIYRKKKYYYYYYNSQKLLKKYK